MLPDLSPHDLNLHVLVSNELLKVLDLIDLKGNFLGQLIEPSDELLFLELESSDVQVVPVALLSQNAGLVVEEVKLLVEVNLFLSDDVQVGKLVIDESLSVAKGSIHLVNLISDLLDLLLGVHDHLLSVIDLTIEP